MLVCLVGKHLKSTQGGTGNSIQMVRGHAEGRVEAHERAEHGKEPFNGTI